MNELLEILEEIKKRPQLYLGRKSLELLNAFISGFYVCQCRYQNRHLNITEYYLSGFQTFIEQKYNLDTTHSWSSLIRFFCSSDEEAFDKFYVLLNEYLLLDKN